MPVPDITFDDALERAYKSRPDYQAALERVKAAEATRAAAVGDNLPSVTLNADYGELVAPGNSHCTFAVVGAVNIPIFQGGRTRGSVIEAEVDLKSRRAEADDLRAGDLLRREDGVHGSAGNRRAAAGGDARAATWRRRR